MQPAKRARTGEDIPLDECTRHANLYLEDGNVVLRCDNVLFKIYRGLLSRNSEIFRDMFSLSIHQPVDAEQYEGSPMICLHDSAADFESFMLALLDSRYVSILSLLFNLLMYYLFTQLYRRGKDPVFCFCRYFADFHEIRSPRDPTYHDFTNSKVLFV